ncbi:MAG TPA: RNA 2',3'-cyclic phosphodiesterase [Actinomycetota bacterium]|nr:RNA 2',3'-cyclic phosphodiesterase [Actinomycetota bacterium]
MGRDRADRPEATPDRLFLAIEIPGTAKAAVEEAFGPWREAFPKARWVPAENWHVTVKFLGRTWPRLRDWVPGRVASAAGSARPFAVSLQGVGSFPSRRKGRVLWAGLDDGGRLGQLAAAVDGALLEEFPVETRPFHAHLTVARSDPPVDLPEGYAETELRTSAWEVDALVLFRSHLRRPAPVYEPLARFPFAATAEV